jgi:adhesin transport system outer membrane protein
MLSGCMGGGEPVTMQAFSPANVNTGLGQTAPGTTADTSAVIHNLQSRKSVLPPQGPYASVAQSVLAASRGRAEADLRVARLKAQARSSNWLPELSPNISLSSLDNLVTSLVVQQVLFDNGKKKAEREYAAADVEVAAVSYSSEMNERVATGLSHYVGILRAREQGAAAREANIRMKEYDRIMRERVKGGLSDMSEARVISQKYAEMDATVNSDADSAQTALAQLNSMADRDLGGLSGTNSIQVDRSAVESLSVVMAEAQRGRSFAESKIERANHLPGLTAGVEYSNEDHPDYTLNTGVGSLIGFGTKDTLSAIDAGKDSADAAVAEARQDAEIKYVTQERKLIAARAKYARDAEVIAETGGGLALFTEQYKVGRRTLLELVNMYESYAAMERAHIALKYDIALLEIDIARELGLLADGTNI